MKLIGVSILAVFFSVSVTAFSDSSHIGSTSPKNIELRVPNEQILSSVHNANHPFRQKLQRANRPEINPQVVDKVGNQQSSNQHVRGREPAISYSTYPNVPGIPNATPPFNLQTKYRNTNISPQGTTHHRILSHPNIHEIYAAAKPTKRYTVIHSNGTVEHTDDLHSVAARYPDYVLVQADDILRKSHHQPFLSSTNALNKPSVQNNQQLTQNLPEPSHQPVNAGYFGYQHKVNANIKSPVAETPQAPIKSQALNLPTSNMLHKEQSQIRPTDSHHGINKNQPTYKNPYARTPIIQYTEPRATELPVRVNNPLLRLKEPNSPLNQQISETLEGPYHEHNSNHVVQQGLHENAVALNPTAVYTPINKQGIPTGAVNNLRTASTNPPIKLTVSDEKDNKAHENAMAINPLPIYPSISIPQDRFKSDKVYGSPASVKAEDQATILENKDQDIIINPLVIKGVEEAILVYNSSLSNSDQNGGNQTFSVKLSQSSKPITTLQIPAEKVQHETLPVILPQVSSQDTVQSVLTPTAEESHRDVVTPGVATIVEMTTINPDLVANTTTSPELPSTLTSSSEKIIDLTPSKDTLNSTNTQFKTVMSVNNTNAKETVEDFNIGPKIGTGNGSSTNRNYTDESSTTRADKNWDWFELSDEQIFGNIMNNSRNVYFFFMPSQPKVFKETKTTIYPNGTTVQEITETEVISGQDGEPEVKQTKKLLCS